jgi:acetyltransferase
VTRAPLQEGETVSIRNLERLFDPRSVAVIGASSQPQRIGARVLANLVGGAYGGAVWPVNPKYDALLGLRCYGKVSALPSRRSWPSCARRRPPYPA